MIKFQGIWIPRIIWFEPSLTLIEKVTLSIITAFDVSEKGCFASTQWFSNFLGVSDRHVRRTISSLSEKKLIEVKLNSTGNERTIHSLIRYARAGQAEPDFGDEESTQSDDTPFRGFLGIFIPAEIWLSDSLSVTEKVLYAEIESLAGGERGCYATNSYLGKLFKLTERQISRTIGSLAEKNFITIKVTDLNKREIRVAKRYRNVSPKEAARLRHDVSQLAEKFRMN